MVTWWVPWRRWNLLFAECRGELSDQPCVSSHEFSVGGGQRSDDDSMVVHGFCLHGGCASQGLERFAKLGCHLFVRPLVSRRVFVIVAGGGVHIDAGVFAGSLFGVLVFSEGVAETIIYLYPTSC